ncbi:MAG: Rieske (2Fe-2S) protein [Chloroflexi bacterium]|nr:Rieske (2Fe-2S) protein [Chloroflexota bacterium]
MARHVVCRVEELPPGSRRIVPIGRRGIGIFNVNGTYHALHNVCPHAGAPLCLGRVTGTTVATAPYQVEWVQEGEILRCPWHGWEFEIASGETITEPVERVQTYSIFVEDGQVIIEA